MERITLLSIAIFLFASITKAQITKGSTFIGGQISGGQTETKNGSSTQKQSSFYVSPAIGTAIKQNLIAGIDFTYGQSKNESGYAYKTNTYGGGFFLRRYVPIATRFYFFLQGRAGYSFDKSESSNSSSNWLNKSNSVSLGLYPGVSFALTKALHIEAGLNNLALLGYSHSVSKQPNLPDQTSNNFNFRTSASGTDLSFALRFIIPKK
jgi:hypothetical protein